MSDSGEMGRVAEAVERIDASLSNLSDAVTHPQHGLVTRMTLLEERARVDAERRKATEKLEAEMQLTHRVGRWVGMLFTGAILLALANQLIEFVKNLGR